MNKGAKMVNDRLHIICGNCGQDLKESDAATWEYVPAEIDEESGEVYSPATVYIHCENCATIHSLNKYIKSTGKTEFAPDCEQIRLMRHALGLDNAKTYKRHGKTFIRSYSNYYQTNAHNSKWEELHKNKFAEKHVVRGKTFKNADTYIYYYVSDIGIAYMEKHLQATIKHV